MLYHAGFMDHCEGSMQSMSFSPPISYHQARICYLGVFAQDLFRGMGPPIFPFGLVAGQSIGDLYAKS